MVVENELLSDTLETKQDESNDLRTEMVKISADLARKSAELDEVNERFRKWKKLDMEFRSKTKAKLAGLRNNRDTLRKVKILSSYMFLS
jgi:hypothetical protein